MKGGKVVRMLDRLYGYGFASVRYDDKTGMYQGFTSRGDSTAKSQKLSDCMRALLRLGYK